jgi:hypothetical protein
VAAGQIQGTGYPAATSRRRLAERRDDLAKGDIETYYEDGEWKSKREGKGRAFDVGGTKAEQ